jgi:hypothetical protein
VEVCEGSRGARMLAHAIERRSFQHNGLLDACSNTAIGALNLSQAEQFARGCREDRLRSGPRSLEYLARRTPTLFQ